MESKRIEKKTIASERKKSRKALKPFSKRHNDLKPPQGASRRLTIAPRSSKIVARSPQDFAKRGRPSLVLSCLLSSLVLSCLALPCLALSFPALSCLVLLLSCLVLSCRVVSCLVLSCRVASCLVVPCLALPYLALPRLALSCLVLFQRLGKRPSKHNG